MRTKLGFLVGAAAGYVLGTRAGRERYDQIVQSARQFWENPKVQQTVGDLEEKATVTARDVAGTAQQKVQDVRGGGEEQYSEMPSAYDVSEGTAGGQAGSNGRLP